MTPLSPVLVLTPFPPEPALHTIASGAGADVITAGGGGDSVVSGAGADMLPLPQVLTTSMQVLTMTLSSLMCRPHRLLI